MVKTIEKFTPSTQLWETVGEYPGDNTYILFSQIWWVFITFKTRVKSLNIKWIFEFLCVHSPNLILVKTIYFSTKSSSNL